MIYDLIIKNGIIVTSKEMIKKDLVLHNGKVVGMFSKESDIEARKVVYADGKYILPGLVDVHVHGGYGSPERETFHNVSMAAAAGGITTILEQPLSVPSTVTLQALLDKKAKADLDMIVDFGLWGGLVSGNYEELQLMYNVGAMAYKSFMCRCSNYPMTDDGTLLKGMKKIGELGGLVAVHAENDTLIQQLVDDFNSEGKVDAYAFLKSHPVYSELEAIQRFIFLSQNAPKCKAHIVHMSIPQGAELIKKAKERGINITAETCPQYLGLCEDDLINMGGVAKCDPPVRSKEEVNKLWQYVIEGTIDMIASDHSPHPFEKKFVNDFSYASEGVTGIQTMLSVILTEGVFKRGLSLERVVELTSHNPARRFGLYPQKGCLNVGSDADFVIIDLNRTTECKAEDMYYLNKHTPFDGRKFNGYIEKTFVRGILVCEDNQIKVEKGFGKFVAMNMNNE